MDEWEEELLKKMQRAEAPESFADAVLARVHAGGQQEGMARIRRVGSATASWPSLLLLAASLVVAAGSALEAHHQQKEKQAQQIAGEFNQAMAVTARTLHHIDRDVSRAGATADHHPEI